MTGDKRTTSATLIEREKHQVRVSNDKGGKLWTEIQGINELETEKM